ncbi:E3 ubiquitin/ISG15 ligase TRIM25 isoform X2 [Candoia aspera]|uniref:E3 ubiquitin/ISG15 ligase TRIM25 isoform X2 n=1 Tax=Candoia aspera TaxID=51853 RepID=UPI002FD82A13
MASLVKTPSLVGLEDELTCSICLCVFETPVTTPCGHNFCLPCLEMTWTDLQINFSCPQCRACFETRPQLKKNTVLCKVVEQFQVSQGGPSKEVWDEKRGNAGSGLATPSIPAVTCDSCLEVVAAKTCLTCMASFCREHLRPHLESPAFKGHHLVPPVKELQQRKCQSHNKLLEFFCKNHGGCICCFCLVSHKMCTTAPLQEAKEAMELQLKKRLTELFALNEKASQSLEEVQVQQKQISNTTSRKLDLLKSEFVEIIALIHEEENNSVKKIKSEEKKVLDKYEYVHTVLGKKKNEIQRERDEIEVTLTEMDDITFLKKATKLRQLSFSDVFVPRIDLDQGLLGALYQNAFSLKEGTKQLLTQPQENKTKGGPQWKPKSETPPSQSQEFTSRQRSQYPKRSQSPRQRGQSSKRPETESQKTTLDTFLTKPREELLQFAVKFTLDFHTAHKNVMLSERNTRVSVSETVQDYRPHPQRFISFSQVLSFQCFKKGIHYWEVELENNNFCAVGVCYGSIPKHGPESRLGRNNSSWCIEWINGKISAWHNDKEKCLPSNKAKKIGVLLNYDGRFIIFFGVTEKNILLYKFKAEFTEALYPAFWVFSSGASISLCQLK